MDNMESWLVSCPFQFIMDKHYSCIGQGSHHKMSLEHVEFGGNRVRNHSLKIKMPVIDEDGP